jgi:hypothetical protein
VTWGGLAHLIQQTSDGGYIVTGEADAFNAGDDIWVLKLRSAGDIEWQKAFGGSNSDYGYSIRQTSDGGYIVAGETLSFGAGQSDAWILKLDSDGTASSLGKDTSAAAQNTSATVTNTTGSVSSSTYNTANTSATITDTNAVTTQQAP